MITSPSWFRHWAQQAQALGRPRTAIAAALVLLVWTWANEQIEVQLPGQPRT